MKEWSGGVRGAEGASETYERTAECRSQEGASEEADGRREGNMKRMQKQQVCHSSGSEAASHSAVGQFRRESERKRETQIGQLIK